MIKLFLIFLLNKYNLVDVWEPKTEDEILANEPIIYHGGTMTSHLSLTSALDVINELAFERTRFNLKII